MRRVLSTLNLATVLVICSGSALACVCGGESRKLSLTEINAAIANEFNESALVFSGEVISKDTFEVKFRVKTVWKGDHLHEITMSTGAERVSEDLYRVWSCDYWFSLGEKYLVYARFKSDGKAVARYCTRTTTLTDGKTDIPQLDTLNPSAYQAPTSDSFSSCWIDRVEDPSLTVGLMPDRCARGRRLSQLVLQFSGPTTTSVATRRQPAASMN